MIRRFAPALIVVALAFAMRMTALDDVRQNFDRAYPHGLGIAILERVQDGRLAELPTRGVTSSIALPNPVGASYAWAAVALFDRSPYVATALMAMANVLVTAIAFALGRKTAGTLAGVVAGALAATSVWSNWVARGAWLQGSIELFAALTAWLAFTGLMSRSRGRIVAAGVVAGVAFQTYLVAAGLFVQLFFALLVGGGFAARLRRAGVVALACCAVSVLAFGVALAASRDGGVGVTQGEANPHETRTVNLDPFTHALRIASGRDFENTFVGADIENFSTLDGLSDARATLVEAMMLVGLVVLLARSRRDQTARAMSAWAIVPALGAFLVANVVFRAWDVHVFYIMLMSPMSYVLAGLPLGVGRLKGSDARIVRVGLAAAVLLVATPTSLANALGEIETARRTPITDFGLDSLTLANQRRIAEEFRRQCQHLSNAENEFWLASMIGSACAVSAQTFRQSGDSSIWQIAPSGASCAIELGARTPPFAQRAAIELAGEGVRSSSVGLLRLSPQSLPQNQNTAVNLGWRLSYLDAPTSVEAGEMFTVTEIWRIESLPSEPFATWYFAPFVKLVGADGATVATLDNAPSLEGHQWRAGNFLVSAARLRVPSDAKPGAYSLRISLFDPNQKKNAVYFDPAQPSVPIVELERKVEVRPRQ